ncbi:MAG TPA: flagellin [Euryarchaeota archaeon]|nr:flagellin [Euryarchaeota archaeon]
MPASFSIDSRAESGMGALLIFIAMMLVSAVVASVIIETSYVAQQRAQNVANNAISEISSGLKVLGIVGDRYNPASGTLDNKINYLIIDVSVHSGSDPLDLRKLVVEITDTNNLATLVWGGIETSSNTPIVADATHFSVKLIRNSSGTFSTVQPVIHHGDIVRIYVNATAAGLNISPQTRIQIKIIPQPGVPTIVDTWTPDVYIGRYIVVS